MPKRRPIFEFRGLSGFLGSPSSNRSYGNRSGHTDESPRRPSFAVSSRYQSPPRHRHHSRKHKNRHKHHKHHYSRHAHYAADQRYRQRRYEEKLQDQYHGHRLRGRSLTEDEIPEDFPSQRRRARFADEYALDGELGGRNIRSPSSHASRGRSPRSPMHHGTGHLRSPPPFDPDTRTQYQPPGTIEYPQPTQSPKQRTGTPSGSPEDDDDERASSRSELVRRRRSRKRRRRRGHKGRRRRRKKRDDDDSEDSDNGSGGGSEEAQRDEDEDEDESGTRSERSKSGSKKKKKKKQGKKRNIAKLAALALGAVVVGLIAKKIITKRKKKKEEQEAQAAAAEQEAAGPFGGSGGQLFAGSNPLQLPVPKASFSAKVPETEAFIVERGGRYNRRLNPGSNILIPFVDRVAFRFSLKEVSMAVPEQQCYTRENISVMASALLFAKVEDAVAVAYGVDDAHESLMLLAQTCMRKEIARLGLEHMLQDRDGLGDRILGGINRASRPWGIRCTRFEIRDLDIPEEVRMALERQAQVERQVRADVFASQGAREAMKNRADGEMHSQMRMSQARQIEAVNQAIGEAHAISERGEAIAGAMRDVAEVIREPGGEKAMQMRIAEQYIHSYANAAKNQDHLPPPPNPAEMAAAMSNAMGLLNNLGQPGSTVANAHVEPGTISSRPTPALEQELGSYSQSGDEMRPPTTTSNFQGPSPGASSHQLSESHQGTPQGEVRRPPPATGTQYLPQNASNINHSVPSSHGGSNISHGKAQVQTSLKPYTQPSPGQYGGQVYPQA